MNKILTIKTDYITFDEAGAESLIEELKAESFDEGYTLTNYSIQKKNKKEVEYFIIKTVKQYNVEKEVVEGV